MNATTFLISPILVGQNDYGFVLQFTIYNSDTGEVLDLTGFTAILVVQAANTSGLQWSHAMNTNTPATDGVVKYTVAFEDFVQAGMYSAQIQLSPTGGGQETIQLPGIRVVQQLPNF